MHIISHGLWAGAAAKLNNKYSGRRRVNFWHAFFWGVFPDVFAFAIPFTFGSWLFLTGKYHLDIVGNFLFRLSQHPSWYAPGTSLFKLTQTLYSASHSLVIFLFVFLAVYLIWKKPIWAMGGWGLHIIFDIPTHRGSLFPTPAFWPISNWHFNGVDWAHPSFVTMDVALLVIVYIILRRKRAPSRDL